MYVGLGDRPHRQVYHRELDLVGAQLFQSLFECLQRAVHVGLEDDLEFIELALCDPPLKIFEGNGRGREVALTAAVAPVFGHPFGP